MQIKAISSKILLLFLFSTVMVAIFQAANPYKSESFNYFMPVYFFYLLVFFVTPVMVLMWLLWKQVKTYRRTLLWTLLFIYTFGALWDWLSVQTGLWNYDTADTLGVWIFGLPIEEFVGFYVFGTMLIALVALYFLRKESHV